MLITPRDYQITAHDALWAYFDTHTGNPVVAMPTGTGKSVNIAMFCYAALVQWSSQRFLALTHVKELVRQNYNALMRAWPEAPAGIYSAGLKRKDTDTAITFGGVASVAHNVAAFGHIDILIIDECDLLSPDNETMYQRIIKELRVVNPWLKVVGFTATPYRMGFGLITAPGGLFTDFAVNMTSMEWFNWFIDQGYLTKLVSTPTQAGLDVTGVHMSGGDYNGKELNEKLSTQDKEHYQACEEMVARGQDRRKWLIFTAGTERAEWVSDMLVSMGISATFVHSNMDDPGGKERDRRIAAHRAGEYRAMVGNNIFTTGYDDAEIDLIGVLRPSKSPRLWVQVLGRGMRPCYAPGYDVTNGGAEARLAAIASGGKRDCLVLDFAKNTETLGPVNDPVIPKRKGEGSGDMPIKICPSCGNYQHLSVRFCKDCGAEFPIGSKLTKNPFAGDIVRREEPVLEWFEVSTVIYRVHRKNAGRPMVRVTYVSGFRSFDEFVFIEHDGYLGKKARDWWRTRANMAETPPTAEEFVKHKHLLRWPKKILVQTNKPYPEVQRYEYE